MVIIAMVIIAKQLQLLRHDEITTITMRKVCVDSTSFFSKHRHSSVGKDVGLGRLESWVRIIARSDTFDYVFYYDYN